MQTLKQLWQKFVPQPSLRVVLDTNVLISATIVRHGFPARILQAAIDQQLVLVVSPYLLAEYLAVIQRPHIAKKYLKSADWFDLVRRFIAANAISVSPVAVPLVLSQPEAAGSRCHALPKVRGILTRSRRILIKLEY